MENSTQYGAKMTKILFKAFLFSSGLAALSGCGLRGELERPPPIFSTPLTEEASVPVDLAVAFSVATVDQNKIYLNSLGGEIPKPAPGQDVFEESMDSFGPS